MMFGGVPRCVDEGVIYEGAGEPMNRSDRVSRGGLYPNTITCGSRATLQRGRAGERFGNAPDQSLGMKERLEVERT